MVFKYSSKNSKSDCRKETTKQNQFLIDLRGEDTPVLLTLEVTVSLPQVIVGVEVENVVTNLGGNVVKGGSLLGNTSNGLAVGVTLSWPTGLNNENLLTRTSVDKTLVLLGNPSTGVVGGDTTVKVGVGVGSNVVRDITQTLVGVDGNEGVNRDNRTGVTSGGQSSSTFVDIRLDLGHSGGTSVDQLVTDGDGVDLAPAVSGLDGSSQGGDTLSNCVNKVDTSEKLLGRRHTSQDVLNLVTVDTIKSNHLVSRKTLDLRLDLTGRLTGTVGSVRGVGNTLDLGTEGASRGRDRGRRRLGSGRGGSSSSHRSGSSSSRGSSNWGSSSWGSGGGSGGNVGVNNVNWVNRVNIGSAGVGYNSRGGNNRRGESNWGLGGSAVIVGTLSHNDGSGDNILFLVLVVLVVVLHGLSERSGHERSLNNRSKQHWSR